MLNRNNSIGRFGHEYNLIRMNELNKLIIIKEKELTQEKGFLKSYKKRKAISKLYKELNILSGYVCSYDQSLFEAKTGIKGCYNC